MKDKLTKIKEFLKKCKSDKKILAETCIICLKLFDNCDNGNHCLIDDDNGEQNNDINIINFLNIIF